jgi:type IX secretion system PorP/SprF family membrane protein
MLRIYLGFICYLWFSMSLHAQQLPYFTQFRQHQPLLNPASVNSDFFLYEYNVSLATSYRMQWISHPETPRTLQATGEFISDFGGAFELVTGISFLQDRTGPFGSSGVQGRIGSIFTNDPYFGGLSVGLSIGMVNHRVSSNRIIWKDPGDPLAPDIDFSVNQPELGVGVFYYRRMEGALDGDNIYLGLSAPQLLHGNSLVPVGEDFIPLRRVAHYYATAGWYHFFNQEAFLETSMWAKYTPGAPFNLDIYGRFQPARPVWFGAGFGINGLAHLEAGFNVPGLLFEDANLKIGYGFDYNISAFDLPLGASHELHLTILFDTYR